MTVLIVDDEAKARRLIRNLLLDHYGDTLVLLEAKNLLDAVAQIKESNPAIVLLDIKMPQYSGLEIVNFFDVKTANFQVIFTTAFNDYAIEAFKMAATDYLLKPIDPDELIASIEKAKAIKDQKYISEKLEKLQDAFVKLAINKIALDVPRGFKFVNHDDIIMFEADGMYTKVYIKNKPVETISKPLKHFVAQLKDNLLFYKPQRSFLINLKYLAEVKKNEGLYIILDNGTNISVSREKRQEFLTMIETAF